MALEKISSSQDLRTLSHEELKTVADELRTLIIETVAVNGGHLASNLGIIELTIALHHAFNSPVDRIVWDVGHQSYAHKSLTGRKDKFSTLRTEKGISGFAKIAESPHDSFGTGHRSSTSISAALGLLEARDQNHEHFKVIAVIGDGALSGGIEDPEFFTILYRRYLTKVYRYLYFKTGDTDEAEDLTSQVFLAALEGMPGYQHRGHFSTWLFSIARRKAADFYRTQYAQPRSKIAQSATIRDPEDDPLTSVIAREKFEKFNELLSMLDDHEMEILRLRFTAKLQFSEIAILLKRKPSSIKMAY